MLQIMRGTSVVLTIKILETMKMQFRGKSIDRYIAPCTGAKKNKRMCQLFISRLVLKMLLFNSGNKTFQNFKPYHPDLLK